MFHMGNFSPISLFQDIFLKPSPKQWSVFLQTHLSSTWYSALVLFILCGIALMGVDVDAQHGPLIYILFLHVPASWLALALYAAMAMSHILGITLKRKKFFYTAQAIAPIGAAFALISLVTGAIWGKPAWGTWWVWDARLTSMCVLFLFYVAYLNITRHPTDQRLMQGAYVQLLGALNLPIVKWSVTWWSSLHQRPSITLQSSAMDPYYMATLFLCVVFFSLLAYALLSMRLITILSIKIS